MSPVELSQSTGARPDRFALQNPRARFANRLLGCRALATSLLLRSRPSARAAGTGAWCPPRGLVERACTLILVTAARIRD